MITIGEDVIMLYSVIAVLTFLSLILYLAVGFKGFVRWVITTILLLVAFLHYVALAMISRFTYISFLPLLVVESTKDGSVVYPDFGQVIALLLIIGWRREITRLVQTLKGSHHGEPSEESYSSQATGVN